MLTYPNILESSLSSILESSLSSSAKEQRLPMSGTVEQIGADITQIKAMGVEHIIFAHVLSAIGKDMTKMIEITKQLARFAK
jgi:hypothetical protein